MQTNPGSADLLNRMVRAAKLEPGLYEEVEAQTDALGQALTVVIIVALASGISALLNNLIFLQVGVLEGIWGFITGFITALIGWFAFSFLAFWVGTNFFGGTATYGEVLRTVGFADSPGVLAIFGFIPCIGWLVAIAGSIWVLVATVIAVRQALDFTTGKAIATAVIGWVAMIVIIAFFSLLGLGAGFALGG